jgi:hypothetical protein
LIFCFFFIKKKERETLEENPWMFTHETGLLKSSSTANTKKAQSAQRFCFAKIKDHKALVRGTRNRVLKIK